MLRHVVFLGSTLVRFSFNPFRNELNDIAIEMHDALEQEHETGERCGLLCQTARILARANTLEYLDRSRWTESLL